MTDKTYSVFAAEYSAEADALADFDAIIGFYRDADGVDTLDAAVIARDVDGKVSVIKKREEPTRHGAEGGLIAGLVAGALVALFPAIGLGAGLVVGAVAGAGIGGWAGHVVGGMSRHDLADLGEVLDNGTAGLIVVAATDVEARVAELIKRADKVESKQLKADAKELNKELRELSKGS